MPTERQPDFWREQPFAPPIGKVLGPLADIPDGQGRGFDFGHGRRAFRMFVLRRGERALGYVNRCPHFQLPLNHNPTRFMNSAGQFIMCSQHLALFRIEDGYCVDGAALGQYLHPVPVHVADGMVVIGEG